MSLQCVGSLELCSVGQGTVRMMADRKNTNVSVSTRYSSRPQSLSRSTTPISQDCPPRFIHKCTRLPGQFANFHLSTDLLEPEEDLAIPSVKCYKQGRSQSVQRTTSPSTATTTPLPTAPAPRLLRCSFLTPRPTPAPSRPQIRLRLRP